MAALDEDESIIMNRQCMFCGDPIAECMGYVLPRDILPVLEAMRNNENYAGPQPRELCSKDECGIKWHEQLQEEEQQKLRQAIDDEYENDRSAFDFPSDEQPITHKE
jgi:hypothetical protein